MSLTSFLKLEERTQARRLHSWVCLGWLVALIVYIAAYLLAYLASPSGRFPMLDAAENINLASQIAGGTLPPQPFYRAMLYPASLAGWIRAGVSLDALPIVAAIEGCFFHLGSTLLVYLLARRAWASARAGLVAAIIFGFNPVALYFAAEPLDTTLGLFLFLAGLNLFHSQLTRSAIRIGAIRPLILGVSGATLSWVLAMLARPHYAIVLAGLPGVLAILLWRVPQRFCWALASFAVVAGISLGSAGLVQRRICGEFRIMPTQGTYSLWAGNRPGANGRYYEQQIHIPAGTVDKPQNPAHIEAEVLYRRETGDSGPLSADRMNAYWKGKTVAAIRRDPCSWLSLMVRKVYYLFNDFEQYNNKTFAVQKALSPMLSPNPLGWGVTFVLCVAGLAMAISVRRYVAGAAFAIPIAGLYAAGVVIFFVSDRFRLPLLPFLCVGTGALGAASRRWFHSVRGQRGSVPHTAWSGSSLAVPAITVAAAFLTFSRAWGVYDLAPAVQDHVLLSIAEGKAGHDLEGLRWARRALEQRPDHPDAIARAVTSFYNLKIQGSSPEKEFPDETWQLQAKRVLLIPQPAPGVRLVQAVALWKTDRRQEAVRVLHSLLEVARRQDGAAPSTGSADDSLGVLLLSGLGDVGDEASARLRVNDTASPYLLVGLARREIASMPLIPASRRGTILQAEPFMQNIFP